MFQDIQKLKRQGATKSKISRDLKLATGETPDNTDKNEPAMPQSVLTFMRK